MANTGVFGGHDTSTHLKRSNQGSDGTVQKKQRGDHQAIPMTQQLYSSSSSSSYSNQEHAHTEPYIDSLAISSPTNQSLPYYPESESDPILEQEVLDAVNRIRGWSNKIDYLRQVGYVPDGGVELGPINHNTFIARRQKDGVRSEFKSRIWFRDGRAWIYEVPSMAHSCTVNAITDIIRYQTFPNQHLLHTGGAATLILQPGHSNAEPDQSLRPLRPKVPNNHSADGHGNPYPTLVIEAAKSQSLPVLHQKCLDYFMDRVAAVLPAPGVPAVAAIPSTIRIVIGVKIYPRNNGDFAMLVSYYQNGAAANPVRIISCGTTHLDVTNTIQRHLPPISPPGYAAPQGYEGVMPPVGPPPPVANPANPLNLQNPCNALGLPLYQLQIPTVELFNGAPPLPPGVIIPPFYACWNSTTGESSITELVLLLFCF
ncbi:hypothetical protein PPL_08139 [Heterostelium album PN500]|uniref:Uncharacterized protein n=1 Tax=Heterostelium pallidum (strain ATCC 26659 / Pp 5 / PN500) TaxID=670386 RepID=D3BIQ5_HETP5|nr:hypothetical protein PPL_08139 [Heterostelium album PN500]EFA78679.1 hypothetical protein PPL_08139 [Heterostelium album PN500]|eukprot:XP_020430803.1 hypothetical protein PPL_08139 [Heterostelium album PN500]